MAYRGIYSPQIKSRDLILKILSFCPGFSLADVFIKQDDVSQALQNISGQVVFAFNDIMKETEWTKQCLTLNLTTDDEGYCTLKLKELK